MDTGDFATDGDRHIAKTTGVSVAGAPEVLFGAQLGFHTGIKAVTFNIVVPTKVTQIVPCLTRSHGEGRTLTVEFAVEVAGSATRLEVLFSSWL